MQVDRFSVKLLVKNNLKKLEYGLLVKIKKLKRLIINNSFINYNSV